MESLTITHVDKVKGFLVIYGHKKPELLQQLQTLIDAHLPSNLKHGEHPGRVLHIDFDTMYLAYSRVAEQFQRCFVIEKRPNNRVVIDLMDYGTECEVAGNCLIELDTKNRNAMVIQQMPPIATKYFLAGFFCAWKNSELGIIKSLIDPPLTVAISNEQIDGDTHYISLRFGPQDLAEKFLYSGIGITISFTEQRMEMRKISHRNYDALLKSPDKVTPIKRDYRSSRNLVPNRPLQAAGNSGAVISKTNKRMIQSLLATNQPRDATDGTGRSMATVPTSANQVRAFVASELVGGQFHMVYGSYVHDGPRMFYVRLKSQEHILDRITNDLFNANLSPLHTKVSIGMACIARSAEDKCLHRAVIQQIHANGCRVTFVDLGTSENVPSANLFEIQDIFLRHKTFAVPFQLHNCHELEPLDDRISAYFEQLVGGKELELKIVQSANPQLQQCELFADNLNIFEALRLRKQQMTTYPEPAGLSTDEMVIVRYAYTAKQLYVARIRDEQILDEMQDPLAHQGMAAAPFKALPAPGECCVAFNQDEWFRAIVLYHIDPLKAHVKFVDYGFEDACPLSQLRPINERFVKYPRQAIQCCLIEFDQVADGNVPVSTGKQIDMAADTNGTRTQFRAIVHQRLPNAVYVIDLREDVKKINLADSIWRLAMPRKAYEKRPAAKGRDDADKVPKVAPNTSRMSISSSSDHSDVSQPRGCDGAEHLERFVEARAAAKERPFGKNYGEHADRQRGASTRKPVDNGRSRPTEQPKSTKQRSPDTDNTSTDQQKRKPNTSRSVEASSRPKDAQKVNVLRDKRAKRSIPSSVGKRLACFDEHYDLNGSNGDSSAFRDESKVSDVPEELVGFDATLPDPSIPLGSSANIVLQQWLSPFDFYVTLKAFEAPLDDMMRQLQRFYTNRRPVTTKPSIGALVIVWHQADEAFKRAKIIDYSAPRDKFKVHLIDFGGRAICLPKDIYELERSFARLAPLAVHCTLDNDVVLNRPAKELLDVPSAYVTADSAVAAEFIRSASGRAVVSVQVNQANLVDLMVRDRLLVKLPDGIRMERLIGQTLIAHITSITSVTCFQARFYGCDITFMCSFQNLGLVKNHPQLNDQFRAYENKYINITIESIDTDNVFGVAIHLPFLHTNANDNDILEYPFYNDTFECEISSVLSAHEMYVQNKQYEQLIRKHADNLYSSTDNSAFCMDPMLGNIYSIQSADGNFYRGRILQKEANGTASVHWVDYGNTEVVALAQVKTLHDDYKRAVSALAHRIFVPIEFMGADELSVQEERMFGFIGDAAVSVNIVEMYGEHFICDLLVNGKSVIDAMAEQNIVRKLTHDQLKQLIDARDFVQPIQPVEQASVELAEPAADQVSVESHTANDSALPDDSVLTNDSLQTSMKESLATIMPNREVGCISHSDNPNRFYMHLLSDKDAIEQFDGMLQIVAPSLPALSDKRPGQLCIAMFSIDDRWYRARIIDTSADITSIQFIDYGNTDTITDETLLKACNESLAGDKPFAMQCSMPIQPLGSTSEWHEDACAKLNRLLHIPVEFELLSKDGDLHYVKLHAGGRDITEEVIFEGWAEACETIKSDVPCYISHLNGLDDFYIQLAADTKALALIELHLTDVGKYDIVTSPKKGFVCSALFEDGKFYRAQIADDAPTEAGHPVEFIDFGNAFATKEVRSLDPDIAKIPHLRKHCSLKVPDDIESWTDEAEQHFGRLAADGQTEFTVRMVKPGKRACVELFIGAENVSLTLSQHCRRKQRPLEVIDEHDTERDLSQASIDMTALPVGKQNCAVSHINGPDDFYVQLESNFGELDVMAANLSGAMDLEPYAIDAVPLNAIVGAYFPDDHGYYRAKMLEKCGDDAVRVQFIDFGNECVTRDLRKLVDIVRSKAPLALQCKLADNLAGDESRKFVDYVQAAQNTTFQFEIVDRESAPVTVVLYVDDVPVGDVISGNNNGPDDANIAAKPAPDAILDDIISEVISMGM